VHASTRHAGRIVLSLPGGGTGPLELSPAQGGWIGTFTVTNLGAEPLAISRIALRGDERDVRSPSRLSVHFAEGPTTSATLAPGAAKDVVVAWMPDRDPRVRQAFGQIVVTSTDEDAGEVAMGFRAQLPTGLGWLGRHVLSALVALPVLVLLAALSLRASGRPDHPAVGKIALGVASAQLLLAAWAYGWFAPGVGRADGNDGFQLVERAVWVRSIGAEWYVGVDGVSIALVLLTAIVALVAVVVAREPDRRTDAYHSALALLVAGVFAALVALDAVMLLAAWVVVGFAIVLLAGGWGGRRGADAAAKAAVYAAAGGASLLAAVVAMASASGRTFLVDGTTVAHTLAIPELGRTSFAAHAALGIPLAEGLWILLFITAAVMAPIVPFHGWLPDVLEEAPAGSGIVVGGASVTLGPYLLVRVGMGTVGEGAAWAGPWVATLGVIAAAYGALAAMAQPSLKRVTAFAIMAGAGMSLYGAGSLTTPGVGGAIVELFGRGIACALLLGAARALELRGVRTSLGRPWKHRAPPAIAVALAAGLACSAAVPCTAGLWGPLLALLGGFPRHPALGLMLAGALVVLVAASVRVACSALLDPQAGSPGIADASAREAAGLAPLVLLALLIGLWPAPLLGTIATGASDASAAAER
jgi:NADH-quinone oxidoreductase subunit M